MVLIELDPADNPEDSIVLLYRGRKEFQDEESTSLGSGVAISGDIEWFALPCRGEEPAFTQTDKVLYDKISIRGSLWGQQDQRTSGLQMTFTPPARAALQSPFWRARHA